MTFKAIIVGNDPVAVQLLKKTLNEVFFEIEVSVVRTPDMDAAYAAFALQPDLVFMDCNSGGMEVLAFLARMKPEPEVIFLSANPADAALAYKYNASGFIPKPVEKDVLASIVSRTLLNIKNRMVATQSLYRPAAAERNFFIISSLNSYEVVKVSQLMYCVADGRYTEFRMTDGTNLLASRNLSVYDNILSGQKYFFRASRSAIINFEYVKRVKKKDGMQCEFADGSLVPVSKRKIVEFNQFLQSIDAVYG